MGLSFGRCGCKGRFARRLMISFRAALPEGWGRFPCRNPTFLLFFDERPCIARGSRRLGPLCGFLHKSAPNLHKSCYEKGYL